MAFRNRYIHGQVSLGVCWSLWASQANWLLLSAPTAGSRVAELVSGNFASLAYARGFKHFFNVEPDSDPVRFEGKLPSRTSCQVPC